MGHSKYGESSVLRGIDFQLDKEKVVIVGPNGSGKSTLFRAMLGLVRIEDGSVRLFGEEIREGMH